MQLPDVVEEVLAEGITCSISFNRHGTILAGETAVPVTSKTCCIVVLKPYYPLLCTGVTVRLSCHRSRLPGWQDCPVGFRDPECSADPRGAQVQSGMETTHREQHARLVASFSQQPLQRGLPSCALQQGGHRAGVVAGWPHTRLGLARRSRHPVARGAGHAGKATVRLCTALQCTLLLSSPGST